MHPNVICGGCLCGSVRYEVTGVPYNVTHCHCSDCRRSSGAPFVTWASFRRDHFRFLREQPNELSWAGRVRSFCSHCGTPLTFFTEPDSEEIDVTVCSFDRPETVTPADHTWVEDRLDWIRLADDLPGYRQARQKPSG
ncbi:MAG TPA: GFA family protein [Terrimicrobiaceae bacterium]